MILSPSGVPKTRQVPPRLLAAAALATAAWLVPGGCARSPDLLVVLDPYTEAVMGERGLSRERIKGEMGGQGLGRVEVVAPETGATGELRSLLSRLSPRGAYLSSLLASEAGLLAAEFPDTVFFLDGPLPGGGAARGGNVTVLGYDLAAAYAEAGSALAALLSGPELPPPLRSIVSESRGRVVGIVAVNPDKTARRELQLFQDALSPGDPETGTEYRELDSLEDRAKARRSIERLREEGIGIFLLRVSTLSGFCLEVLQKVGGLAIVESEAGIEAYADVLLLTLERDVPAALRGMAAAAAGGEAAGAPAEAGSLRAPVRLRWWNVSPEEPGTDE